MQQQMSPQDVFQKLQTSSIKLLPFLYQEAVSAICNHAHVQKILQEDWENAVKLYRKKSNSDVIDNAQVAKFMLFPNGLQFAELDFAELVKIFIHFKLLSTSIISYFDANAEQNGASEFMYSKAKLLIEYRNRLSGHLSLKYLANNSYSYNYTNAIFDLLAFVNFFNTTQDSRFRNEIRMMNQYTIQNLYGVNTQGRTANFTPQTSASPVANPAAYNTQQYQPQRKAASVRSQRNQESKQEKKPQKKKGKKLILFLMLFFLLVAGLAYVGARYGFGSLGESIKNSPPWRFIETIFKSFRR